MARIARVRVIAEVGHHINQRGVRSINIFQSRKDKKSYTIVNLIASIAIVSLLSGCIGFREKNVPNIVFDDSAQSNIKKTSAYIDWSIYGVYSYQEKQSYKSWHLAALKDALLKSGCCTLVENKNSADLKIEVTFYDQTDSNADLALVLGVFSLGLIPSWANVESKLDVKISSPKQAKSYIIQDSLTFVQWLPFAPISFFIESPSKIDEDVKRNLYRVLASRIIDDGLSKK